MLNIVIPMAGRGSRFADAGYSDPKPFIPVCGVPMIELVINNLRPTFVHRFIFICQKEHLQRYSFAERLLQLAPGCEVIGLNGHTEGALCSVLAAEGIIDSNEPLLIANSDQWVDINIDDFLTPLIKNGLDGLIMTMKAEDAKWSYVRMNSAGWVTQVIEKEVISGEATVGIYGFKRGKDFCYFARQMIADNERSKGEFYVAPVYTRMSDAGFNRIGVYNIGQDGEGMYGLGTPPDLKHFLRIAAVQSALSRCKVLK